MKILCVIQQLGAGGAERVMTALTAHLAQRHEVTLFTWESPATSPFYPVSEHVRLVRADLVGGRGVLKVWRVAKRLPALRRGIRESGAQVIVSFLDTTNILAIIAAAGIGVPVVVSERTDPAQHVVPWYVRLARRFLYPHASRVVVQTRRVATFFSSFRDVIVDVVPNPIPAQRIAVPSRPGPDGRFRIIAVGRLEPNKGFDRLVEAFALIAAKHPDWDVVIFGEGDFRPQLVTRIRDAGLEHRVTLAGRTDTIGAELASAHMMAFPSRYEGFPNALAEAARAGLPAVAFAGVSGVEDIIVDGVTGVLVPFDGDTAALADGLDRLIGDAVFRERAGAAAARHGDQWKSEIVLGQWEALLTQAAHQNGGRKS